MTTAEEVTESVLRHGQTSAARALTGAELIEVIHRVAAQSNLDMDAPIRGGEAILEREHSRTRVALGDLVAMAVDRGIEWQAVTGHFLANRPWELIPMIPDLAARADAYRLEIHYAEQTAAALRTRRGAWLGQVLDGPNAPTKVALAGELGCSRPTLDKWLDKGAVAV